MSYPVIVIRGEARAGKDTAGAAIAADLKGCTVAFADPLKRLAMAIFGFTVDHCWGDLKDVIDPRYFADKGAVADLVAWQAAEDAIKGIESDNVLRLVKQILPHDVDAGLVNLRRWFYTVATDRMVAGTFTPRFALQQLGTEWGRATQRDCWVDLTLQTCRKLLRGGFTYDRVAGIMEGSDPYGGPRAVVITDGRFPNELAAVKEVGGYCIEIVREDGPKVEGHASETATSGIPAWWYDAIIKNDGTLEQFLRQARWAAHVFSFTPTPYTTKPTAAVTGHQIGSAG
jgi:hypothetical protein